MPQLNCPQCGDHLSIDENYRARCLMCGWGGSDGVDPRKKHTRVVAYALNKPLGWRLAAICVLIVAVLSITTCTMYFLNLWRSDKAIAEARAQMGQRLYASAAKTLYSIPHKLIPSSKIDEANKLLVDNVRWARDMTQLNAAKASLAGDSPEAALADLASLELDFPHDDEALDLLNLSQELTFDPSLDISQSFLDGIAFTPNDPAFGDLAGLSYDSDVVSAIKDTEVKKSQPSVSPAVETPPARELPSSPAKSDPTPQLMSFYHLVLRGYDDNLYSIDLNGEVNKGLDKVSGQSGYAKLETVGRVYNKPVTSNNQVVPLYRYYSKSRQDHYYTIDAHVAAGNNLALYQRQQIAGFVGKWSKSQNKCLAGNLPLHNVYNKNKKSNKLVGNQQELAAILKYPGNVDSGVVGCIWK
jgi:hypothetical protein